MDEDPTRELPKQSFEDRVLAELAAIRTDQTQIRTEQSEIRRDIAALELRVNALEERVDARLRETRPMWEAVQRHLQRLEEKFDNVIRDLYEVRADIGLHDKRLSQLERRVMS